MPWWTYVGAVSGGGLGFIVANIPGLMLGALAGNRLGAVRDAKGKSVAAVFNDLAGDQKAEVRSMMRYFWGLTFHYSDSARFGHESSRFSVVEQVHFCSRSWNYL